MAAGSRSPKGRSSNNAGCIFWLAALIVVLTVFLLNLGKIKETLESTHFSEIVKTQSGGGTPTQPVASAPKVEDDPRRTDSGPASSAQPPSPKGPAAEVATEGSSPSDTAKLEPDPNAALPEGPPAGSAAKGSAAGTAAAGTEGTTTPDIQGSAKAPAAKGPANDAAGSAAAKGVGQRTRQASLFFIRIDDDGAIVRQEVKRPVPYSDSPLGDALGALLKGPSEEELRKKLISLIPQGTKLLSVQVRGSTAVLNFNETFMYNRYGIEGYAGQLKQVVYTATSFGTVQDVLFLIEGEKHDYLGGEGVYIGRPLSRNSF